MVFRRFAGPVLGLSIVGALAVALGSAPGCGGTAYLWLCFDPDGGLLGNAPTSDTDPPLGPGCPCAEAPIGVPAPKYRGECAFIDGGADGGPIPGCSGRCVPALPSGWSGPVLFWSGGVEIDPPNCPAGAPVPGYEGYAGLTDAGLPCGACTCSPSSSSCGPPGSITASTGSCGEGAAVPFAGPPGWDGGCTAYSGISGDAGVVALAVGPLALSDGGCTPTQGPVPDTDPSLWKTRAVDCSRTDTGGCPGIGETCAPPVPAPFRDCIFALGVQTCPSADISSYTEQLVFYGDSASSRDCSPCGCAPPDGGTCTALISLYTDDACGGPGGGGQAFGSDTLTDTAGACLSVPPGYALGSKSISSVSYTPGTCQPTGGVPVGSLAPIGPSTFCCIP